MISKAIVLPADTYILISKSILNDQDRKLITMLYQPIIGSIAANLYFTFWSYLDRYQDNNLEFNHYHLMTNMQLKLDDIIEAREKLEGIGLIKTYIHKSDNSIKKYIYEIYSPLNAYEFISSPLLNTLLINNIGNEEYDKIISLFKSKIIDLTQYNEITCSFSSVFKISNENVISNIETNVKRSEKNKVNIESKIDINSIITLIPDEMLNKKNITKEIFTLITNLSFVYNLNEEQMKDIIINSINAAHTIDREKLKLNCQSFYEFNNGGRLPGIIYKKGENVSKNSDNSNRSKMIYAFETTSPYDFLSSKYGDSKPTKTDLKLIEYLLDNLSMQPGVVNVLIDYVLKTNDNKLTKSYVETIAGQWKRSNITSVPSAIELAKKEYNERKKIKKSENTSSSPKWMHKQIESTIATKEEQEQISNMLKELVGE